MNQLSWKMGFIGAYNALTAILAVRLTLLVAVCGAIGLAYLALMNTDAYRVGVLITYMFVVGALVWLTSKQ